MKWEQRGKARVGLVVLGLGLRDGELQGKRSWRGGPAART
jgi:hypothetical protein